MTENYSYFSPAVPYLDIVNIKMYVDFAKFVILYPEASIHQYVQKQLVNSEFLVWHGWISRDE